MSFAHLHVHTEYSLLDGSNKIGECIAQVRELGMDSVAITDHGVMYGVIDFYKAAQKGSSQSLDARSMWRRAPGLTRRRGEAEATGIIIWCFLQRAISGTTT